MAEETLVRGSQILGVFDQILRGPQGSMRAVEITGRGIAAEARCMILTLEDKMRPRTGPVEVVTSAALAYADRLIELSDIADDLVNLWHRRRTEDIADTHFEEALDQLVTRLEEWARSYD